MPTPRSTVSPGPLEERIPQQIVARTAGFSGGLDTQPFSGHLDPTKTPRVRNYRFVGTETRKRYGFANLGTTAFTNPPIFEGFFLDADGLEHVIGISRTEAKFYDSVTDDWIVITPATPFSGSDLDPFDATIAGSDAAPAALGILQNLLAVANGVDTIHVWDFNTSSPNLFTPLTGGAPIARYLSVFADRLVSAYITDSGADVHAQRIQWPVSGNIQDWTGLGSGSVDLVDIPGEVTNILPLGDRLMVYKQGGIQTGIRTGERRNPIGFLLDPGPGLGLIAPHTLKAASSNRHIFLGSDFNVYIFASGATEPVSIGDEVQREIEAQVNKSRLRSVFAAVVEEDNEYHLFVPTGTNNFSSFDFTYNWREDKWSMQEFSLLVSAAASIHIPAPSTIDALPGTIDSLSGLIDDLSGTLSDELLLIASDNDNRAKLANRGLFSMEQAVLLSGTPFHSPTVSTSNKADWTSATRDLIFTSNAPDGSPGNRAINDRSQATPGQHRSGGYVFADGDAPADAVIVGVEVTIEGVSDDPQVADRRMDVNLLSDVNAGTTLGGTSTKVATLIQGLANESANIITLGSSSDIWGLAAGDFLRSSIFGTSDTTFGLGLTPQNGGGGEGLIRVDHVQIRVFFTSASSSAARSIISQIDTIDTDFGLPGRNKTLQRVRVFYRDVGSATNVKVLCSNNGGVTFQAASSATTESVGDSSTKFTDHHIVLTGNRLRARIETDDLNANHIITDIEMHALPGGILHVI